MFTPATSRPRVVIAGASGFLGRHLTRAFAGDGWDVKTIGRSGADATWGGDLGRLVEGADALVNLAGRSVSCRYSKANADAIFRSRTRTTRELGLALAACDAPPPVWLNASTGTIYRDARDRPQDEDSGELGDGFSVEVARAWERELDAAPVGDRVRRVALRTTIVLGPEGGALSPLINLARLGFGGPEGDGGQRFSWLHVDDVHGAIRHIIDTPALEGPVNLASPHAVTNVELMAAVRRHLGRPVGLPLPAWSLEAGARIIRTEAELVLKSRWVHPGRLLDTAYAFRHPELDGALADIARRTPRGLLRVQMG
ncbi:TIGR01777 family oxidoreductase [Mariniluteicoccus flavus]